MSEEAQVKEEYKVEDALLAINECLVAVHKRLEAWKRMYRNYLPQRRLITNQRGIQST